MLRGVGRLHILGGPRAFARVPPTDNDQRIFVYNSNLAILSILWVKSWNFIPFSLFKTLSEAIGSLGCRRNSSDGSMLIRQLTEPQLLTCSDTLT